jgi:DNA-binding transcriptional MerR regulator
MTGEHSEAPLISAGPVARELGIAVETLRLWERTGKIAPARRTTDGRRLWDREEVEMIRRGRSARQAGIAPQVGARA